MEITTVLVVDDELLIRDLLCRSLTSRGYSVLLAQNGQEAIEMIKEVTLHTALVDLKMPGVDGLEVTSAIGAKDEEIPVIIMTAYPSYNSAVEALREGVYDYIVKPFGIPEVLHTVERAVKQYEMATQRYSFRKIASTRKNSRRPRIAWKG